jgi:hypothetical protein
MHVASAATASVTAASQGHQNKSKDGSRSRLHLSATEEYVWPTTLRVVSLSFDATQIRVFVSWNTTKPPAHLEWFSVGDWSLDEFLVR